VHVWIQMDSGIAHRWIQISQLHCLKMDKHALSSSSLSLPVFSFVNTSRPAPAVLHRMSKKGHSIPFGLCTKRRAKRLPHHPRKRKFQKQLPHSMATPINAPNTNCPLGGISQHWDSSPRDSNHCTRHVILRFLDPPDPMGSLRAPPTRTFQSHLSLEGTSTNWSILSRASGSIDLGRR